MIAPYCFDSDILDDLNHALSLAPSHLRPPPSGSHRRSRSIATPTGSTSGRHTYSLLHFISASLPSHTGVMARPTSSQRPAHIALPSSSFPRASPNGSPSGAPGSLVSPGSPRSSFLPNFIRNRSRAATITGRSSPRVEQPDPIARPAVIAASVGLRDGALAAAAARDGGGVIRSVSTPIGGGLVDTAGSSTAGPLSAAPAIDPKGKTHRIRLVPHLESSRSLAFDPVIREVYPISVHSGITPSVAASRIPPLGPLIAGKQPALVLKIGRFTDKTPANGDGDRPATGIGGATIAISGGGGEFTSGKIAFRSKVVSRTHAEIWCEAGGKFYIRDTSSSSGTFLNHIRLSSPNTESRPTQLNDGDVLQLGVDYQGGHEDQFRCVKMRVEMGREWQRAANEFNTNALKQLKALGGAVPATPDKGKTESTTPGSSSRKSKGSVTDCCICLFSVTVCQSLFIAPCSHVFHYKCIRPLLMQHHPGFSCPLCRTFANLEEDVEIDDALEVASRRASIISRRLSNHSIRLPRNDPSQHAAASGDAPALGEPSTGVGLGAAASSVDELLAGESGSASEEGGRTEDDSRQDTKTTHGNRDDIEMYTASREASLARDAAPAPLGPTYIPVNNPGTGDSSRRSSSGYDPLPTASIPDVQTPRNEYFLSTLAPGSSLPVGGISAEGTPSVHQQLERAEGVSTIPEENDENEGSASSRARHRAETTLAVGDEAEGEREEEMDERRRRAESEMMMDS